MSLRRTIERMANIEARMEADDAVGVGLQILEATYDFDFCKTVSGGISRRELAHIVSDGLPDYSQTPRIPIADRLRSFATRGPKPKYPHYEGDNPIQFLAKNRPRSIPEITGIVRARLAPSNAKGAGVHLEDGQKMSDPMDNFLAKFPGRRPSR